MPQVLQQQIPRLLAPYLPPDLQLPDSFYPQIGLYLDLILLWNNKTNLTAIRDPETLLQRQIGESLFAAAFIPSTGTLLDFGSGGGFPGIPLQLALPDLQVTLAESQGKKASFLREAVRTLGLKTAVAGTRVEAMQPGRQFDVVAMRAVDQTGAMLPIALQRVASSGTLLRYLSAQDDTALEGWLCTADELVPNSQGRLALWSKR